MLAITPIYAALIALLFVALSARVILYRLSEDLSLGDEGDRQLLRRMRAQGNCAEYAPLGLLLLLMAEFQGLAPALLHGLGLMLLAGRLAHSLGFSFRVTTPPLRVIGTVLTLAQITVTATLVLYAAL